jgi:hypothetical protein
MLRDSKYAPPKYLPTEQRLRAFERSPEVPRIVVGPLKRNRRMKFCDGDLRVRQMLETGYVIVT